MSPKVTEEYKQTVRENILQAAEDLFACKGYHETSMDDIVNESGLSKGAIYGYFKSKQEIFLTLSDKCLESELSLVRSVFSPNDSALKKLEKSAEVHFDSIEESIEVCRMNLECYIEAPRIEPLQHRIDSRYKMVHKFIADMISEGIKKGEFRQDIDPDILTSIIQATIDGLSLHRATTGQDFDWQKIKSTFLTVFLEGINIDGKGAKQDAVLSEGSRESK